LDNLIPHLKEHKFFKSEEEETQIPLLQSLLQQINVNKIFIDINKVFFFF
jgi:hypothetical protein